MINKFRFLVLLEMCICLTVPVAIASDDTAIYNDVVVNGDGWYLVEAIGCKLPIPNKYLLMTDGDPFFFYEVADNKLLDGAGHIKISSYDFKYQPKSKGLEITLIKNQNGIHYEQIKRRGKDVAYSIRRDNHVVFITHVDDDLQKRLSSTMFNYCIEHMSN
mgnify:CR=1 FL=1